MEFLIGLFIFVMFAIGFARMDSNLIKITKSVQNIEKELAKKEKK